LVTDLPADFEVFGQAVDTDFVDLLGGTTGQVLSKTSATDLDFTWVSPNPGDITEVTVTSPITGGGSSGSVNVSIQDATTAQKGAVQLENSTSSTSTTTAAVPANVKTANDLAAAAIPKSTVTTNGDLIYGTGSATVSRIGIGSTGNVLTVAAGIPSWAAPAGGGGMTLLQSLALTGATVTSSTFSSAYKQIFIYIQSCYGTARDEMRMRLNADTGSNYAYHLTEIAAVISVYRQSSAASAHIGTVADQTAVKKSANFGVYITTPSDTNNVMIQSQMLWGDATLMYQEIMQGIYDSSAAITSITLFPNSGTFTSGTAYIYGVN
jgi:hypothetical protein